jgi:hypothetical protein
MANAQRIAKPAPNEYPEWFSKEIEPVPYNDLVNGLSDSLQVSLSLLKNLNNEQLLFQYQAGKWTIKEIWQHIIDVERILAYRALRYARKDKTVLHGFNENNYAQESKANSRPWNDILDEYRGLRESSIHLFTSFNEEMIMNRGTAGRSELTVRAVGFLILGHNVHHLNMIKERYLVTK